MIINKEIIEKLNPCKDRFDNFVNNNPDFDGDLQAFLSLDNITYSDKVWVVTRLFTKEQNVHWSLLCASSVLSNFESVYPDDKRPRLALEAAQNYLDNPSEETMILAGSAAGSASRAEAWAEAGSAAESASRAAWAASRAEAWSAAGSATWSAAGSASRAAARAAARSAARLAAESAARLAAGSAAWSAAWSAAESAAWSAAGSAALSEQEDINLMFMIDAEKLEKLK